MKLKDLHGFASDRPINAVEDDLLGRANFSKDLADALASWHGNDSLVVALHGDWGTGKSSIKNMAVSKLASLIENRPDIIEFTPWEWAAQDKITASFFQEISISIGRKDKSKSGKKLAATLKKYGRYLNTGESIVTGLSAALPTLFILATVVGIGGNFINEVWVKDLSLVFFTLLAAWAAALKWGKDFLNNIGVNFEISAKGQELGLNEIRKELTDLLTQRSTSLIVVMDDLDRLTSDQLRMVFQLVKANLEFPNVVFLLLFQRDLIEEKLSDGKQSGRDYLEKIIQVPFDIPRIETTRIHNLFFSKLDEILKQNKSATEMFDSEYWGNLFHSSIYAYFDNLRNVYRYTSTLSFHFSLLKGKTAFEVNPVDLIAVECLRLFEPDVYKAIARAKEIFTKNGSDRYGRTQEATKALILGVFEKASEDKKEIVGDLIKQLFPTIQWALGGTGYSGDSTKIWLREMRICHPSNFDKYFQFTIPKGELSNSDLREMLNLTSDAEKFASFVMSLQESEIITNALAQFESFTDQVPLQNRYPYVKGLLDIGDKVDHESLGFTMFSANTYVVRLAVWFLRRIESIEDRSNLLLRCFKDSDGISVVEHILQADENRREKSEGDIVLSNNEFSAIKQEFVKKLNYMAENAPDELLNNRHLVSFLYRWKRWGSEDIVTSWLQKQVENTEGCIKLLKAFVTKSSSQTLGEYAVKITNNINLENIENFIQIEPIIEKISGVNIETMDVKSQEAIEAFKMAVGRRAKGIDDDS